MGSKKYFSTILLILLVWQGSSQSVVPGPSPEYQYPYSDEVGLTDYDKSIEYAADSAADRSFKLRTTSCNPNFNICVSAIDVDFCGETYTLGWDPADGRYKGPQVTVPSGTGVLGPDQAAKCSEGIHKVELSAAEDTDIDQIVTPDPQDVWVSSSFGQERAEGKFLYLIGNTKDETSGRNLNALLLTDEHDKWDPIGAENTDKAYMYVEEKDISGNEKALYELEPGVLPREYTAKFKNIIDATDTGLDEGNGENTWVAQGSVGDGDCSDDPCALVNWRQDEDVNMNLGFSKDNITPVHSTKEMYPDGEIAVGYQYYGKEDETDSGDYIDEYGEGYYADSMKVFLCKKPNHGLLINEKSDGSGTSYICDAEEKEWSQTHACSDGIDNDDDGKIDHPDSKWVPEDVQSETLVECESQSDDTETEDTNCKPRVGRLNESMTQKEGLENSKVAFHEVGPNGKFRDETSSQECLYNDYMAEVPEVAQSEVEFSCYPDGSYDHPLIPEELDSLSPFKQSMVSQVNELCTQISLFYPLSHGDSVAVSQVKYNETYLPKGPTYASSIGYNPFVFQTLPAAEELVYGSADAHNYTAYLNKGIPSTAAKPYQDPEQSNYLSDAWTIGNFMAPKNPRIRGLNPIYEDGVMTGYNIFQGGYAGKCHEDQPWGVYSGEQRCMPSDYKTKLDYILPDVEEETETVGLKLIQSSLLKFYLQTGSQIDKIDGACWRGLPEDRPDSIEDAEDAESFVRDNIAEDSIDQTLEKVGQSLNIKVTGVPTDDPGRYTCSWSITDKNGVEYGSSDFEPYNWFEHRRGQSSAEDIIQTVQNNIESKQWPETVKENLIPSYNELDNISEIPDQVSANFFERDDIS